MYWKQCWSLAIPLIVSANVILTEILEDNQQCPMPAQGQDSHETSCSERQNSKSVEGRCPSAGEYENENKESIHCEEKPKLTCPFAEMNKASSEQGEENKDVVKKAKQLTVEQIEIRACRKGCESRSSSSEEFYYDVTSKDYYFDSYAHFGIHEDMIKDNVRTNTYRKAIQGNPHLFRGKVVLDVGSGLGILSLFAAKAGAARVIGIEASAIAELSKQIVKDNNLTDVITIVRGKVEEVQLPHGIDKVDVIISEWMGYCLLFESMLSTVVFARDHWLRPGGALFPDRASIYLTAIEDGQYKSDKIHWWDSVYGFNMSAVGRVAITEPIVDLVDTKHIVTSLAELASFDLNTVRVSDLSFSAPFALHARRPDYVHALVVFFSVEFLCCHTATGFSTGPDTPPTHWKQTIFYLKDYVMVLPDEEITGVFVATPNLKSRRDLDVRISVKFDGKLSSLDENNVYKVR